MSLILPSALPNANEVHAYRVNLDQDGGCFDLLSEDEIARAYRFHFKRDARRWTAGRMFLRRMLGAYLDTDPHQLQIETNFWGKPGLPGCPLRFNVTHSGAAALLAFAWQQEVGIDIEHSRCDFSPLELAAQICSPQEQSDLRDLPPAQQYPAFLTLWTAKEAYVKARGEGLSFPVTELTLSPMSDTDRFQVNDLANDGTRPDIMVCQLDLRPDYFAALALEGPLASIRNFDYS